MDYSYHVTEGSEIQTAYNNCPSDVSCPRCDIQMLIIGYLDLESKVPIEEPQGSHTAILYCNGCGNTASVDSPKVKAGAHQ